MKTNYDFLIELIEDNDEAIEFATALKAELDDAGDEITRLEEVVASKDSMISSLQDEIDYRSSGNEIECGIGKIIYSCEGSIDLMSIMEALAARIEKDGYKGVLKTLEATLNLA